MKTQDKWKKSFSRKTRSHAEKFWEKVDKSADCWIWLGHIDKYGYGKFWNYLSHRFAWILTNGEIPKGLYVCHHCDNPSCVNPAHLFLGTQQDNMDDMVKKGRTSPPLGERNGCSKLTEKDVLEIRRRLKVDKVSMYRLAKEYRVSATNIRSIALKETWKHV